MKMIETQGLAKVYERPSFLGRLAAEKRVTAVTDISLSIGQGELFGLLGSNGAGKTTLVKMLCTLILPSSGQASVASYSLVEEASQIRAAVGLVVADERSFYWRLSARQNLSFFAAMYGLSGTAVSQRVEKVLAQVDLLAVADRRFSHFSAGMRQRLAIARSLLHKPRLLFLDEPTRSLDPIATQRFHELLFNLRQEQDLTIFLVTHDLMEAEKLCDRLAVMHNGRIQASGSPDYLRQQLWTQLRPQRLYHLYLGTQMPHLRPELLAIVPDGQLANGRLTFRAADEDGLLTAVLAHLHQQNISIHSIEAAAPSLEEVFSHHTKEPQEPQEPTP